MLYKFIFLALLLFISACALVKHVSEPLPNDPWDGKYRHFSGKFDLVLHHYSKDATAVDIFAFPSQGERSTTSFFAEIKNDQAIYKDIRGEDCRFELKLVLEGIIFSEACHGSGENTGLYRRIGNEMKATQ